MVKKAYTLYLDEEYVDEVRSRNYKLSQLCNESIKVFASEDFNDIEEATRIAIMDDMIAEAKVAMDKKTLELSYATNEYNRIIAMKEDAIREYQEAKQTMLVSGLIRELNRVIIANEFDIEIVRLSCMGLIESIHENSEYFDLDTHIARLKNVLL